MYGGYASAGAYSVFGTGAVYSVNALAVGANYSNIRFSDLNDPASGTLSQTNPFGYHGTAIFNSYSAFARYQATPTISLTATYDYLTGGAVDGKEPAKYNQFNATVQYILSKRTTLYYLATYQVASGVDSTGQSAVASIESITPSNNSRQLILRLGILHFF